MLKPGTTIDEEVSAANSAVMLVAQSVGSVWSAQQFGPVLRGNLLAALDTEGDGLGSDPTEVQRGSAGTPRRTRSAGIPRPHSPPRMSLEEAMLQLYHTEGSVAKAEQVARSLLGKEASIVVVCECGRRAGERVRQWLGRRIDEPQKFVFLQALKLRQKAGSAMKTAVLLAAIGVRYDGNREVLAVVNATPFGEEGWNRLLLDLKQRGLRGTDLFLGANDPAEYAAIAEHFPKARYQLGLFDLERTVLAKVPPGQMLLVMKSFAAIKSCSLRQKAVGEAMALLAKLRKHHLAEAADTLESGTRCLFNYFDYPKSHWIRLRDGRPLRKTLNEFRQRIRLIGPVNDDEALRLLFGARLRYTARTEWAGHRYIVMRPLGAMARAS